MKGIPQKKNFKNFSSNSSIVLQNENFQTQRNLKVILMANDQVRKPWLNENIARINMTRLVLHKRQSVTNISGIQQHVTTLL